MRDVAKAITILGVFVALSYCNVETERIRADSINVKRLLSSQLCDKHLSQGCQKEE